MHRVEYNNENDNWHSKVSIQDITCYFDMEGRFHRLDGPAVSPDQWLCKDINVTYNFQMFAKENQVELNEENFKIFLFERKLQSS
jgi:hypothetical protein